RCRTGGRAAPPHRRVHVDDRPAAQPLRGLLMTDVDLEARLVIARSDCRQLRDHLDAAWDADLDLGPSGRAWDTPPGRTPPASTPPWRPTPLQKLYTRCMQRIAQAHAA